MNDFLFTGKAEKADDSTLSDLSPMSSGVESGQQSPVSPEHKKNQKGIRRLWGKWVFEGFLLVKDSFQKTLFYDLCICIFKWYCVKYFCRAKCRFYRIWLFNDDLWCYWLGYYSYFWPGSQDQENTVGKSSFRTLLILISSEGVSGPRPALDSPAWAPVLLHGISAPIIRYTRHKQAPLFLLLMFYICVLQWHERPLLEMVMWTGVCMDGGVWSGSVREYVQTVGH